MTARDRNPLDSIAANTAWVEALLELFWAVDDEMASGRQVNPVIATAFLKAETARQRL